MNAITAVTILAVLAMYCITVLVIVVLGKPQTAKAALEMVSKALKLIVYVIQL